MKLSLFRAVCVFSLGLVSYAAWSEVRLPNLFSDHAVLQRDQPLRIYGFATPEEKVTIAFHDQTVNAVANKFGMWEAKLQPEKAGGPYSLKVSGDKTAKPLERTDILVGDVWVASGQSNMEMPLKGFNATLVINDSEKEIAAATHPQIRLLHQRRAVSSYPSYDVTDPWTECVPDTAKNISAAGYFFAREVSEKEHVPVGLIDTTWGGMPTQAFTSLEALASGNPDSFADFAANAKAQLNVAVQKQQEAYDKQPDTSLAPEDSFKAAWWVPGGLYNGMIAPFTHYTIKGVIWYQGEADRGGARNKYYRRGFPNMINDWRKQWGEGDFPFVLVQLPSFDVDNNNWPNVRDGQRRVLELPHTAMAVTLDTGEKKNIHPPDKQTVGHRLALAALQTVYGETAEGTSPTFVSAEASGNAITVHLSHADGLIMKGEPAGGGFEVAGDDHVFHPATVTTTSDAGALKVSSPDVASPKFVRYGWTGWVTSFYYNAAGLPLGTFTSEP